jgi:hypothetical protein
MSLRRRLAAALAGALLAAALAVALLAGAPARIGGTDTHFEGISHGPLAERTHSAEAAENRRIFRARARARDEAALARERFGR